MSRFRIAIFVVLSAMSALLLVSSFTQLAGGAAKTPARIENAGEDPDAPPISLGPPNGGLTREEFMLRRSEYIGLRRGVDKNHPADPRLRQTAIATMEAQQQRLALMPKSREKDTLTAAWTELGPNPIPNGQTVTGPALAVSGRTIAIAVDPTNPNLVYAGAAQGGLYRSTNGGTTWTPLLGNALSLAIGAVAIAPSQPDTVYVGTGETNFSGDCFFGVGVYRITDASTASPTISGPLNKNAVNADVFTGSSVGRIAVDPTNPDNIFVATTFGIGGIGGGFPASIPPFGIYRSTNATAASPTFAKLSGVGSNNFLNITDVVVDPGDPNRVIVAASDPFGVGGAGIYLATNALAATPTFGLTQAVTGTARVELTINRVGGTTAVFAATGEGNGRVYRSLTGGASFTTQITNGYCGGQCFYDVAIAVDPGNASRVYLGGTGTTTTFGFSTDGGASFTNSESGLHTDSHTIAVAPSLPSTIYFGSDGGIYKSTDSGGTWATLNNTTFRATQFMSLAVHPTDANFSIGGTQDNGTNFYMPNATWTRADFGDGGYSLIDQNAPDTTNVRMYHTYFNNGGLQGYATVSSTAFASDGNWTFRGCNGVSGNGIPCGGAVLFYAPLARGPGNPNTTYFGANILYRSNDTGLNHTPVSQNLGNPISAIGISPQNDNVRIVGQSTGGIFGTTTGSTTLTNLDGGNAVPDQFVARAVIDPNNPNTAYVTLSAFGVTNVWKTTNLTSLTPIWNAAAGGGANVLPQVPVSAFIVNPTDSNTLFAGTDIGVYASTDGGTNWTPFGTGLPRVAVFDMAIQPTSGMLRIATHGRGLWQIPAATVPGPLCPKFSENFDGVVAPALPAGWVATNAQGPAPLWVTSTTTPDTAPNDAFVDDPGALSDKDLDTPGIFITSASAQVSFRNSYNLEAGGTFFFDGGVLEISSPNINGGAFTDITNAAVGGSFVSGGYVGTINTNFSSPIAGRMAWSGNSGGYINTVANLGPNVAGQTIKLRFRMASDVSDSAVGWRIDSLAVTTTDCPLLSAVSRKVHGGAGPFDVNLPLVALGGAVGIEDRTGAVAGEHQIVVTFSGPVTVGSVAVTSGTGNVGSSMVAGAVLTINLTGVTNAQRLGVTLTNVTVGAQSGDVTIPMGVLAGDTTSNGIVNASDVSQAKLQSGQPISGANFRNDVTVNGIINASDVSSVKGKSGTSLPP